MKCDKRWMPLYAVTDRAWLNGRTLEEPVEAALRGGASCLQLREKDLPHDAFLQEALVLGPLCRRYGVPLIINDNLQVAIESGADGVHIGQHDVNAAEARRRIGPGLLLGVSAQTVEQAVQAERDGADYLGVGAVFSTGTKLDADDVSYETLRAICAAVRIPVVAIGGIGRGNLGKLSGSGIDGIAVVSAIFAADDPERAARELREAVQEELGL
ncbi:MAG: thiamine phosphate synthase [Oscillospiraceae bacterium]|nr:thiamine phosphate synthase [Oscillospiraceae bacterium]